MPGPENQMLKRVSNGLQNTLQFYVEKNHNQYRGGTFDLYIENGLGKMMWVEGKFHKIKIVEGKRYDMHRAYQMLTPIQRAWGARAVRNGINAQVLVGFPGGLYALERVSMLQTMDNCEVHVLTLPQLLKLFQISF